MTPCSQLPRNGLVERLNGLLYLGKHGESHIKTYAQRGHVIPGFCVVCGAKLPLTYRGIRVRIGVNVETRERDYNYEHFEADHSDESLAKVAQFEQRFPEATYGFMRGNIALFPVTICDCVKADLWQDAQRLLKQQEAAKPSARDAAYERRVKAAQRVAGR